MGTCASAPTVAPAPRPPPPAKHPPLRLPAVLKNPERLREQSFGDAVNSIRKGLEKLENKLNIRIFAEKRRASTADDSRAGEAKQPQTVTIRADDLLNLTTSMLQLLQSDQLLRVAHLDSATSANIDTLRLLGARAGRTRRPSSVASSVQSLDPDIANYVLDEFANAAQLDAADVSSADGGSTAGHRNSFGSLSNPPLTPTGDTADKSGSASRPVEETEDDEQRLEYASDEDPTAPLTTAAAAAEGDSAHHPQPGAGLEGKAALAVTTVPSEHASAQEARSPSVLFQRGREAVRRMLTATGSLAGGSVSRQQTQVSKLLLTVAPHLSPTDARRALALVGEGGGWSLDVLELEELVSFPHSVGLAATAHSGDGSDDEDLLAAAARFEGKEQPLKVVRAGQRGSAGHDGLEGVRRLALPFLGTQLLRRHGFIVSSNERHAPPAASPFLHQHSAPLSPVSLEIPDADGEGGSPPRASSDAAADGGDAAAPLRLSEKAVLQYLQAVSDGYMANPYHNATHAIDVMHSAHSIALSPHLIGVIRVKHKLAMLLAAAVHDYKHDGLNNALHTKLRSPLALRYNDSSVLESMHSAEAFALMAGKGPDVLAALGRDTAREVRTAMVQMILATDMRVHFSALEAFEASVLPIVRRYHAEAVNVMNEVHQKRQKASRARRAKGADRDDILGPSLARGVTAADDDDSDGQPSPRSGGSPAQTARSTLASPESTARSFAPDDDTCRGRHHGAPASLADSAASSDMSTGFAAKRVASRYNFGGVVASSRAGPRRARLSVVSAPVAELQEHSMVIAKLTMHAADVSNPVKPLQTYRRWAARCMAEFYHAGDCEKAHSLQPSTFFDREARNMPKCQVGFISFIVRPLFAALSELVTDHAAGWKATLDTNQAYFDAAVKRGALDDEPVDGDWFVFDPAKPCPGARPKSPFLPLP